MKGIVSMVALIATVVVIDGVILGIADGVTSVIVSKAINKIR